MENLDLFKNPIVLGIIAAISTYLFMYWQEEEQHKKNPKAEKKKVNIMTPGVIGALVWFISGSYFDTASNSTGSEKKSMLPYNTIIHKLDENIELSSDSSGSDGVKSYRLVGKGRIQLPQQEVFLDLANW